MKYKNNFQIWINQAGYQTIHCQVYPPEYSILESILSQFRVISQLEWYRNEFIKAINAEGRTSAGHNILDVYVTGDRTEIGYEFDRDNSINVPTRVVLDFIEEAIVFYKFYESNQIPGLIPTSKKDTWSCVPNGYVKGEYWKMKNNNGNEET